MLENKSQFSVYLIKKTARQQKPLRLFELAYI